MKENKMEVEADELDAIINGPEDISPTKLPAALRASMEKEDVKGRRDAKNNFVYSKEEILRYMERKRKQ